MVESSVEVLKNANVGHSERGRCIMEGDKPIDMQHEEEMAKQAGACMRATGIMRIEKGVNTILSILTKPIIYGKEI